MKSAAFSCATRSFDERVDYYDEIVGNNPDALLARDKITDTLGNIIQDLERRQVPPSIIDQLIELEDYVTELESREILVIAEAATDEISLAIRLGMICSSCRDYAIMKRGGAVSSGRK